VLTSALQLGIAPRTVELAAYAGRSASSSIARSARSSGQAHDRRHARSFRGGTCRGVRRRVRSTGGATTTRRRLVAKVSAGEAALANAKTCIQVHGGIGYTWELDVQRYWKRAAVLDTHFGNRERWIEAVAATI
jgi:alkylation response protein AidB-like acyl-CoA dehydrogenase